MAITARSAIVSPMQRDEICSRFLDQLKFDPYPFQEEALLAWFEVDGGLLVSAGATRALSLAGAALGSQRDVR